MGIIETVRQSVRKSIYMPEDELTVFCAALVASHAVHLDTHAARIMLASEQGGFGKTQALRLAEMVTPNAWYLDGKAVSQPAVRSHLMRPERPTVILDEAAKVFGKSGRVGTQSPLYTLLTAGYDKDHKVSVSNAGIDEQVSAYCMMFIGGLGTALPEDALSRTIRLKMVQRPKHVPLVPVTSRKQDLEWLKTPVGAWVTRNEDAISDNLSRKEAFHEELCDRTGEIWGLLVALAAADGQDELDRMLAAFTRIGLNKPTDTRTMDERILEVALSHCGEYGSVFSVDVISAVRAWPELGGMTPRETAKLLSRMIGPTANRWRGDKQAKGWSKDHIEMMLSLFTPSVPVAFVPDEYDAMLEEPVTVDRTEDPGTVGTVGTVDFSDEDLDTCADEGTISSEGHDDTERTSHERSPQLPRSGNPAVEVDQRRTAAPPSQSP